MNDLSQLPLHIWENVLHYKGVSINSLRLVNKQMGYGLFDLWLRSNIFNVTKITHVEPKIKKKIRKLSNVIEVEDFAFFVNLTHLTFGYGFNQPLQQGIFPNSLTHLIFGFNFNQPLQQGVLPNFLTHLTFGDGFNQSLQQGVLSNSLTHLTFGNWFDLPIQQNIFPNSLTNLI